MGSRPDQEALPAGAAAATLFGHPRGLTVLFLTGLWEVFAVFGMRTLLVYYLVQRLKLPTATAVEIYALTSAGGYLMTLVGASITDRGLGLRPAVVTGALLLAGGHLLILSPTWLYASLVVLSLGGGLFKPAMVSLVGLLYDDDDPRRGGGFVLYKLGCNIGGIAAPIVCGALQVVFGWTVAIGACAVGMLIAVAIFLAGQGWLPGGAAARRDAAPPPSTPLARAHLILIAVTAVGASLYWMAANQQGGSLALWIDTGLDRTVRMGHARLTIPAPWFQSLNPIFILMLTPMLNAWWSRPRAAHARSPEVGRMVIGAGLLALSFAIMATVSQAAGAQRTGWIWFAVATLPMVAGELHVDPMGQSLYSRLAPRGLLSTFVSFWFLTQMAGYLLAGQLGAIWGVLAPAAFFTIAAGIAVASGAVLLLAAAVEARPARVAPTAPPVA